MRYIGFLLCAIWLGGMGQQVTAQTPHLDSLRFALRHKDGAAAVLWAEYYQFGKQGLVQNRDSALRYSQLAAAQGHAVGYYLYGAALVRAGDVRRDLKRGVQQLEQAAALNNLLALHLLTELYCDTVANEFVAASERLKPDLARALGYALRAARLGAWQGYLHAGRSYLYGKGTPKNDTLAYAYLDTAATRYNIVQAQLLLGDFFLFGSSTFGIDLIKAEHYYTLAASHKYAEIEDVTWGKVGLHNVRNMPRQAYNMMMRLNPFLPPGILDLRYRK